MARGKRPVLSIRTVFDSVFGPGFDCPKARFPLFFYSGILQSCLGKRQYNKTFRFWQKLPRGQKAWFFKPGPSGGAMHWMQTAEWAQSSARVYYTYVHNQYTVNSRKLCFEPWCKSNTLYTPAVVLRTQWINGTRIMTEKPNREQDWAVIARAKNASSEAVGGKMARFGF